ncbi:hypothetical protein L226DRAFT_607118 [Lentinus tigrinus ALCF2SS1-7]|uniref:uncharacterized protein n=1 Tax=Lentinus tigrinus ALCF2SS1-7 TaxID=1328758 RepID=UPI0011661B12|nr:hypothetical protein L226DRAFT_607118 [Lentinus tigrinus ALCF2SS1-7]
MSNQVARAHTSQSNRAKARSDADRKTVFKSVVDNPFRVQWPHVPVNIQNSVLAVVVSMLGGVAQHNLDREHASRKRRRLRGPRDDRLSKKSRSEQAVPAQESSALTGLAEDLAMHTDTSIPDSAAAPSILQHMVVGINEVTKRLEALARSYRQTIVPTTEVQSISGSSGPSTTSRLVIACRADVDPPILIGHLPHLVAACNSAGKHSASKTSEPDGTWLVPMAKGAENTLAEAIGLRRVAVILIESSAPQFTSLASLLQNVAQPAAPWLALPTAARPITLVPTHIKQLRTSAPKDMKAAKERRSKERAAAKERRRSRKQEIPKQVTLSSAQ